MNWVQNSYKTIKWNYVLRTQETMFYVRQSFYDHMRHSIYKRHSFYDLFSETTPN